MANISETNGTLIITELENKSIAHDPDYLLAIKAIMLLGVISYDDYGVMSDTWAEAYYNFNTERDNMTSFESEGRWGFASSLEENIFSEAIGFYNEPNAQNMPEINDISDIFQDDKYRSLFPGLTHQDSVSTKALLMPVLTLIHNTIQTALLNLKKKYDLDEDITLFEVTFNDYEPGEDVLEINGSWQIIYDYTDNTLTTSYIDGEIISSPTTDTLYDYDFVDKTSTELIDQFLTDLDIYEPLSNFIKYYAPSLSNYNELILDQNQVFQAMVEESSEFEKNVSDILITLVNAIVNVLPENTDQKLLHSALNALKANQDYEAAAELVVSFLNMFNKNIGVHHATINQ